MNELQKEIINRAYIDSDELVTLLELALEAENWQDVREKVIAALEKSKNLANVLHIILSSAKAPPQDGPYR